MTSEISIIVAEDDPSIRQIYRHEISAANPDTRLCENGGDAIACFSERRADLVLLDIGLPDITGLEVCRAIRRLSGNTTTTIIIISSCQSETQIIDGYAAGADDYLIKPVNPSVLRAKILVALDRKKQAIAAPVISIFPGTLFAGRYEVIEKIGAGACAAVYRARDTSSNPRRDVALKVFDLPFSSANDPAFNKHYLREAYGLSRMSHNGVVKLFDFGRFPFYYLAMEYLQGETLDHRVFRQGPATVDEARIVAYEMAKVLQYLQRRNFVHRDIKPVNIIATHTGRLKLLDFGLARRVGEGTVSGEDFFRGTPNYAAPESIFGDAEIDGFSDIFSLGATVFHVVTGDPPFSGSSPAEIIKNRITSDSMPAEKLVVQDCPEFGKLIQAMMSDAKADRPDIGTILATLKTL